MKHKCNWLTWLLSLIVVATYILPGNFNLIYGETGTTNIQIKSIDQNQSTLQMGDSFSLTVKVIVNNSQEEQELYILEPSVSGSGIDDSKLTYRVSDSEAIISNGTTRTITIGGLIYKGDDKKISINIPVGTKDNPNDITDEGVYVASDSLDYTLSAKTSEDYKDAFSIDNTENLIVGLGKIQKVTVKVTNRTSSTINQAKATFALNSSVKGLTIKESEATLSNIKSKETRNLTFTLNVDEETSGGVYPATVSILGTSYDIKVQVDTNVVPSALEINTKGDIIFTPGVADKLALTVLNVGDRDAKNVRLEVVNSENISIVGGGNVKHMGTIATKSSQQVEFSFKVPASVKASTVPVQLKLTYLSSTGEQKEDSQYVYLNTTASAASSEVVISNVISPATTYGVDQNFNVKFNLSSKSGAEKLKITVTGDEGIVPKSQNLFFLNKLAKGETKQYTVSFAATAAAVSSSHPIKIEVEYGEGETPVVINQYGSVNITNPKKDKADSKENGEEENKKGKPKVIIGEYAVNPVVVKAGENFELEIGFLNTHKLESVHNLKANLKIVEQGEDNTGTVFAPVKASNTFYIADLNPGEMQTKKITMYTIPSAAPKTYEVSLEMAYEDVEGNEVTATESIGIPVEQATKVEIGDINVDIGQVGMETYLSAALYNTGKTNVTNVIVHIEGEGFSVQDNKVFIGGFESQAQETYEPVLIPEEEGVLTGRLIIDYEDTTGEAKQVVEEFSFQVDPPMEVTDEMPIDDPMMEEDVPPQKAKWPYIVGIGAAVVVIIIVIIIILKRRKKKKEEMMLDED